MSGEYDSPPFSTFSRGPPVCPCFGVNEESDKREYFVLEMTTSSFFGRLDILCPFL